MAGPGKKRFQSEKPSSASDQKSPAKRSSLGAAKQSSPVEPSRHSSPQSGGRFDGPGDRKERLPIDYMTLSSLRNIGDFLGFAGNAAARGQYTLPADFPARPATKNNLGKEVQVKLNTFNLTQWPTQLVFQYDISWNTQQTNGKRALMAKIWHSKAVKAALGEPQNLWIYDGNKLAWSSRDFAHPAEISIKVDLDAEQGRANNQGKNVHTLFVKRTRKIDFEQLGSFMQGKVSWSNECIDTVNFLDHLLREGPSQQYVQIKKSFFSRNEHRQDLGQGIEAFKGVFSSLRPCLNDQGVKALTINVDVANGTFWRALPLLQSLTQVFKCEPHKFQADFMVAKKDWRKSFLRKDLSRYKRLQVIDNGYNADHPNGKWTIEEFIGQDVTEFTFDYDGSKISLFDYFKQKYKYSCVKNIPVVKTSKKLKKRDGTGHFYVHLPADILKIEENQRYNFKLSDVQTASMIKFAVTLPEQRWNAVQNGVNLLGWKKDRFLTHYGLKVSEAPAIVKGRQLPLPKLTFSNGTIPEKDLFNGRWRLDGKQFMMPAPQELHAWGICAIQGRGAANQQQVNNFAQSFIRIAKSHGIKFTKEGLTPLITPGNLSRGGDLVAEAYNNIGNHFNRRPQLVFFVVTDKNVEVYRRIKKSCDCRYGVASQVVQSRHVATSSPQYVSNVCMKVNAKLGGCTGWAKPAVSNFQNPPNPIMVVAGDVSHPPPGAGGETAASFAALAMSQDRNYTRYMAQCDTNPPRVEMISEDNIKKHFGDMANSWIKVYNKGNAPDRVLYIRDGVSEGQYNHVLEQEVDHMKKTLRELGLKTMPLFTVVIAGKRHHVRFFPDKSAADRNGNPRPGTLVETGVTHPFEWDFYLCSHVAIKGTARPIHYQVILDEAKWNPMHLQQFIFEHSFQYVRSTTPVSLHPAVYYAHLAADRSRAHTAESPVSSGKKESKPEAPPTTSKSDSKNLAVAPPLTEVGNATGLRYRMWYV